jgi:hypothetical protein
MCSLLLLAKVSTKRTNSHLADVALKKWHGVSGCKMLTTSARAKPAMGRVFRGKWAAKNEWNRSSNLWVILGWLQGC